MSQLDLIAAMAFGLESVVADELAALGYKSKTLGNGRVLFRADERALVRANLWLRSADRVLLRLGTFPARDFGQLFDGVFALPWEAWLPKAAAFPVKGRSVKSQLSSVPACQKIVKKAIVERLRKAHRVQSLDESGPSYVVEVALLNDQATLTLDTTGPGLNKRGYRTLVGAAQLKETLAAALLLLCDWKPEQPLIDPFCGTGTIPIEAALLARNMAPGAHRTFAAESWGAVPPDLWAQARAEACELARPALPQPILGSDIDAAAMRQARFHAQQAGVESDVQFQSRDFAELSSRRRFGLLLCNPPYGERLATRREAELLYRAMPEVFGRLPTWSFGVLTSHPRFERLAGRKADSRRKLYNGQIKCWFYHYNGPSPDRSCEPVFKSEEDRALRRYSSHKLPLPLGEGRGEGTSGDSQQEMFANRLAKRARHLRKWPQRGVTCYRIYERDMPEVPLVIDRYEEFLHIVERPRPHERTLAEHHRWLDALVGTAAESLGVTPANIFLKRYADRPAPLAEATTAARRADASTLASMHVVQESGLKYYVNLRDYLDTGLRLDLRTLRGMIRQLATGRRLLSLFGNTGGLAVAAAAGGAVATVTVDPREVCVDWTRQNLQLNGFAEPAQRAICCSPIEYLQAPPLWLADIVAIEDLEAGDEQSTLLRAVLEHLASDGIVFLISSDRRYRPDVDDRLECQVREITQQTVPEDFRNRRAHRVWRIARKVGDSM